MRFVAIEVLERIESGFFYDFNQNNGTSLKQLSWTMNYIFPDVARLKTSTLFWN